VKLNVRLLSAAGVSVVVLGICAAEYRSWASQRDQITEELGRYRTGIADRDREMEGRARIKRELTRLAETMLGTDEETVTAAARTSLNEIVAHYGLTNMSVTTARPMGVKNPAAEARVTEFVDKKQKNLRSRPDFMAISATLNGTGTLEQVTRTMATLEVQPWVHRIDAFNFKPLGKEREQIELNVILTTVYVTDTDLRKREVMAEGERMWRPVEEAEFSLWRPLVAKNVFREPPPPPPAVPVAPASLAAAVAAPEQPPPVRVPYEEWRVSGITRGVDGAQLMLVNEKTKEWKTLNAGGMVLDAKFVDGSGEVARIAIGEAQFEVKTGQRLSERRLVAK
jgi:hypothetical protein